MLGLIYKKMNFPVFVTVCGGCAGAGVEDENKILQLYFS